MSSLLGVAHLVRGSTDDLDALSDYLEGQEISITGNPDAFVRAYAHFGVDEARELRDRASTRALTEKGRLFIIATPIMTTEAQNALLKTLEEPSAQATFFIIVPSPETLLPTLRSRMQTLLLTSNSATLYVVDPIGFLAASSTERLELLKPLLEKDTDERRDLAAVIEFLAGLEQVLAERTERSPEALAAIYRARKYITDKGALVKPLLEQVALLA